MFLATNDVYHSADAAPPRLTRAYSFASPLVIICFICLTSLDPFLVSTQSTSTPLHLTMTAPQPQQQIADRCVTAAHRPVYVSPQVIGYFVVCLWLVPLELLVSLSANENVLPTMADNSLHRRGKSAVTVRLVHGDRGDQRRELKPSVCERSDEYVSDDGVYELILMQ